MIDTRIMPSSKVVQHGVGGEMDQIAAIDERNNLHAWGQNVLVQFLHFLVNASQRRVRLGAFSQQHDAGNHIVVVDDLPVFAVNGPARTGRAGSSDPAQRRQCPSCGAACHFWS